MTIEQTILNLFRIKKGEKAFVGTCALYSACDGVIEVYALVLPLSIFLGRMDISDLPIVYIIAGIVFVFTSIIYNYIAKRISLYKLIAGTSFVLALSVIAFWSIFKGFTHPHLPLALLVWGWVITTFTGLTADCLFSSIIPLQKAKRLYGPLDSAYGLGAIVGSFSLPLFVDMIGTVNSLLVMPVLLGISLFIQYRIKKSYEKKMISTFEDPVHQESKESLSFFTLLKRHYILFVLIVGILISFEYYILEMIFNYEVQNHFQDEVKIAEFLGVFEGIVNIAGMIVSAFVLGWVLEKFGSIAGLFVMPIVTIVIMLAAFMFNIIPATMGLVFWAIVTVKLIESLLNTSVNEQGITLMLQPLKQRERVWAQIQHSSTSFAIAIGGVGLILMLLDYLFGVHFFIFGITLILFCIAQIAFLFFLRKGYLQELKTSLAKHFVIRPSFQKIDKESLSALRRGLHRRLPDEVLFVLRTMEKTHFEEFKKEIVGVLDLPSDMVRVFALSKIEHYKIVEAKDKILKLCQQEVREHAIIALAACGGADVEVLLAQWLKSDDLRLRTGALLGLLKHGSNPLRILAELELNELALSLSPEKREEAALILGKTHKLPSLLALFLRDPSLKVRKTACEAAASMQDKIFYFPLIDNLAIDTLKNSAFSALAAQNPDHLVEFLEVSFDRIPEKTQETIVQVLAKMPKTEAFLHRVLRSSDRRLFQTALHALRNKHFAIDAQEVHGYLHNEISYLSAVLATLDQVGQGKNVALVYSLLLRELELGMQRIFALLSFIYSKDLVQAIENGFSMRTEEVLSNAIELLQEILPEEFQQILTLTNSIQERILGLEVEPLAVLNEAEGLNAILRSDEEYCISSIAAAAMYAASLHHKELSAAIKDIASTENPDPLFQETAQFVLQKLG